MIHDTEGFQGGLATGILLDVDPSDDFWMERHNDKRRRGDEGEGGKSIVPHPHEQNGVFGRDDLPHYLHFDSYSSHAPALFVGIVDVDKDLEEADNNSLSVSAADDGTKKPNAHKRRKKNAEQKCAAEGCCEDIKLTARNDGAHPLCEKHKRAAVARCRDGAEVCFCFYCNKAHGVEEFTHKTNICDRQYFRRRSNAAAQKSTKAFPEDNFRVQVSNAKLAANAAPEKNEKRKKKDTATAAVESDTGVTFAAAVAAAAAVGAAQVKGGQHYAAFHTTKTSQCRSDTNIAEFDTHTAATKAVATTHRRMTLGDRIKMHCLWYSAES